MSERVRILSPVGTYLDVTVIVASHRGARTIAATLRSLALQTLSPAKFEVIVVQNGPPDDTAEVLEAVQAAHPQLNLRRVQHRPPGLGRARNVGMSLARGRFVTFVDDDDTVSPNYLQALLRASAPDVVGVAHVADVPAPGAPADFTTRIAHQLVRAGERISPRDMTVALSYSVGKMLPTELAREVGFDPELRSSEDILFYISFFLRYPLDLRLCAIPDHAVYYRTLVANSMSRRTPSFDFNVCQQLDVIERLALLRPAQSWEATAIARLIRSETSFLNKYLKANPQDHQRVVEEIDRRDVPVPQAALTRGLGTDLWVLGTSAKPPQPPEAATFQPRPGRVVDVLVADMRRRPAARKTIRDALWRYQVDDVVGVSVDRTDPHGWTAADHFVTTASARLADIYRSKPIHEHVHTGAGFAPAHLVGAMQKAAYPSARWVAYVGDTDAPQATAGASSALRDTLADMLSSTGYRPPRTTDLQTWARHVTFAIADEIVFPDASTRDRLVASCEQPSLAARVRELSSAG